MDDEPWPAHLLAANHPTREWRSRSDETWETIRQAYLAGAPARDLCDRYDVALSTLRLKAKEGGWRRADQGDSDQYTADADPWADEDAPDSGLSDDEETWDDLADRARFRLRRAIASGRAAEAASWLRVYDRLRALAAADAGPVAPPPAAATGPDPVKAAEAVAAHVGSIARRAARVTCDADIEALEAEIATLTDRAAALGISPGEPALDSLDALDPVFSDPAFESPRGAGLSP